MDSNDLNKWIGGFKEELREIDLEKHKEKLTVIVAPSNLYIPIIHWKLKDLGAGTQLVKIASQDTSVYDKGAHTGEVGGYQLSEYCGYSIVGHSERKESKDIVLKKAEMCLKNRITPIICFVSPELSADYYKDGSILAWEDPSNISVEGHYKNKEAGEVAGGFGKIRNYIETGKKVIYGGSVNEKNVEDLAKVEGLDGVLVGNASLNPKSFAQIIKAFCI